MLDDVGDLSTTIGEYIRSFACLKTCVKILCRKCRHLMTGGYNNIV